MLSIGIGIGKYRYFWSIGISKNNTDSPSLTQINLYANFGKNRSVTLVYISILVQTENREHTHILLLQFLTPKKIQRDWKKTFAQ